MGLTRLDRTTNASLRSANHRARANALVIPPEFASARFARRIDGAPSVAQHNRTRSERRSAARSNSRLLHFSN
jgi:hypothetical protein